MGLRTNAEDDDAIDFETALQMSATRLGNASKG